MFEDEFSKEMIEQLMEDPYLEYIFFSDNFKFMQLKSYSSEDDLSFEREYGDLLYGFYGWYIH